MATSSKFPPTLFTERLMLRSPRCGDGAEINAAIHESFEELRLWLPWVQTMPSVEESEASACHFAQLFAEGENFHLRGFLRDSGEFVLATGLHPRDKDVPSFEIGYWCRTSYVGCGYVTEAVRAIAEEAFRNMKAERLEIRCDARNTASARVAERAGFVREGCLRHHQRANDGTLSDTLIYARLPTNDLDK